jgi:hypothetical protein
MSVTLALLLAAPQSGDLKCPHRTGVLGDPVIRDEDTAREVFAAVTDQFAGGADWTGIEVRIQGGAGDRVWTVSHAPGSGMAMTIDRCTGAISKLGYQR